MSQGDFNNKVVLVTGAASGIGEAIAKAFLEQGAEVIVVDLDISALNNCFDSYNLAKSLQQDLTVANAAETIADWVARNGGRLDILVNNVGTNKPQPFVDVSEETLDHMLTFNVRSAFLTAQAAAKVMVKNSSGSIIHMSSQMGHIGAANRTVYCMTKHAIEGLTKAMAVELAVHNVRVNSVAPTFIETPLTLPMFEDETFRGEVLAKIPLNRIGKVEDVAAAVLYLASPASNMVTGHSLKVDGGWTAI